MAQAYYDAMVRIDGTWRVVAKTFWIKPGVQA